MLKFKCAIPAALLVVSVLAAPVVMAQMSPPAGHSEHMKDMGKGEMGKGGMDHAERMNKHLAQLHDALKLTPQQEEQWKPVAQVMTDNAKAMQDMHKAKHDSQTALEILAQHSEYAMAHAQGVKKFADAFSGFYVGLTDEQKKAADQFFAKHHKGGHDMHREEMRHDKG